MFLCSYNDDGDDDDDDEEEEGNKQAKISKYYIHFIERSAFYQNKQ